VHTLLGISTLSSPSLPNSCQSASAMSKATKPLSLPVLGNYQDSIAECTRQSMLDRVDVDIPPRLFDGVSEFSVAGSGVSNLDSMR
jgi:hypothetical protein